MGQIYYEEDFYKDGGEPTESFRYCSYHLNQKGEDYDQFALVTNALYPYIRLAKKRGNSHYPCGMMACPATDGWYATLSNEERDRQCPKIAWGFVAEFLANLCYDYDQDDFVLKANLQDLINAYYNKYLKRYLAVHNGLRYSDVTNMQKELNFLSEHENIIRLLWTKSEPLKTYSQLYEYAERAERDYEKYVKTRISILQNQISHSRRNMQKQIHFSTEIRESFGKKYLKVFFLDDSPVEDAKIIIEKLKSVRKVNVTHSYSSDHAGNTLTVYPKTMVDIFECEQAVVSALKGMCSKTRVGTMIVRNEAYFAGIEKKIIEALDKANATIDVCVAWFTNKNLFNKLLEKRNDGITVRVIIYNDGVNKNHGVDLSQLDHKLYRGERGGLLHDKFCVIDNVHTICGSYNWTMNAENKNDEDVAFHFEDYRFASSYTKRFNEIWRRDCQK